MLTKLLLLFTTVFRKHALFLSQKALRCTSAAYQISRDTCRLYDRQCFDTGESHFKNPIALEKKGLKCVSQLRATCTSWPSNYLAELVTH